MDEKQIQNTFRVEQHDKVINLTFTEVIDNEFTGKQSRLVIDKIESIFQKNPDTKFGIIFDLTPLQTLPGMITEESRQIYSEFSKNLQIFKIAIVGANLFYKIATNFLVTASRRGTVIKWFTNIEEAKEWLRTGGN